MNRVANVLRHRATLYLMLASWAAQSALKDEGWRSVFDVVGMVLFLFCALIELSRQD